MISFKDRQGMVLIVSFIVILTLVISGSVYLIITLTEKGIARKDFLFKQAFWLAEAGIKRAIKQLPSTASITDEVLGDGKYSTTTTVDLVYPDRWTIVSTGEAGGVTKTVQVVVESLIGDPTANVDYAMETTGSFLPMGNISIETDGIPPDNVAGTDYIAETTLVFEDIFSISQTEMKDRAAYVYDNPSLNKQPVSNITWVDLDVGDEFIITADTWSGSGILVVNGDFRITGGTFNGVIWVVGTLFLSGNPDINGAVFAESGVSIMMPPAGTPDIYYDVGQIKNAFSSLQDVISWKEVF